MAGFAVGNGALAKCTFGVMPTPLTFLPTTMILGPSGPVGSIADCVPFLNIKPFGVCLTLSNPMTAALTAAALGVFTPAPCIPVPAGTWLPTAPLITATGPAITMTSCLFCAYGGCIQLVTPGEFLVIT